MQNYCHFNIISLVFVLLMLVFSPESYAFTAKLSGQVDRAVIAANNGKSTGVGFVDNAGSDTRFRFDGTKDLTSGLTIGVTYGIEVNTNSSYFYDIHKNNSGSGTFVRNRLANIYLQSDKFGKLTFGKGYGAAAGTSVVDYSGTEWLGGGIALSYYFNSLTFLDNNGRNVANVGNAFNRFGAFVRVNSVRYDSPVYHGAFFSTSIDEGNAYEFAARYNNKFSSGIKLGIATDFANSGDRGKSQLQNGAFINKGNQFHEFGGSASILIPIKANLSLPMSVDFTISGKERRFLNNRARPSAENYFAGFGYIIGKNHFQVTYDRTDSYLNENSKFDGYGINYAYWLSHAIQFYGSYHLLTLSDAQDPNIGGKKVNTKDINALFAGVRVRFF